MRILVTGAAGYIGSVVTEQLVAAGHDVIALDNLLQGSRQALAPEVRFIEADLLDEAGLGAVFAQERIEAVMHLAALSLVGQSVADPKTYYRTNLVGGLNLLDRMLEHGVNRLVFSSSAAVYGEPQEVPVTESAFLAPVNPYGECKLTIERVLRWYGSAYGMRSISLRYFNAAGASDRCGEDHRPETHLIPNVLQAALGRTGKLTIFGDDYPTRDGTCVRDYVHVLDIADAHLRALDAAADAGVRAYNLGTEAGFSNLEVFRAVEQATGVNIPVEYGPRRAGDPPVLVASAELARKELGWTPDHSTLAEIVQSAWDWRRRFPDGYTDKSDGEPSDTRRVREAR